MKTRLLLLLLPLLALCACSEESENDNNNEYANWQVRNEQFFAQKMAEARAARDAARALYGDAWQEHSEWLILRDYQLSPDAAASYLDSIPVQVLQRGTGSGSPLYTDTASVCYLGRLMPTDVHPQGYPFSFTGTLPTDAQVFGETTRAPVKSLVSGNVAGFTTALQHMHIGDRWRIYLPPGQAYGSNATTLIPAYSVLDFTLELRAYFKPQ
ncbi:MAG: FKBP-type peptidyl-prolyl cis-trans isomerase [Bacteroidaceae bacterium]|nr:FKBP-type peptidyl-prolyl cis-trans isomerase [Bacteroidaceae bacterium]